MPDLYVRGEGGSIIPMDLPLPEGIAQRYASGVLVRVNPDGTPWEAPVAAPDSAVVTDVAEPRTVLPRPASQAKKADWVAYAASTGRITQAAADDLTKVELVERFGD